jgi:hypothetical protein
MAVQSVPAADTMVNALHSAHSVDLPPSHDLLKSHMPLQLWQSPSSSAYCPAGHSPTQIPVLVW